MGSFRGVPPVVAPEGDTWFSRESRVSLVFIHNLIVYTTDWGTVYVQIDLEFLRVKVTPASVGSTASVP
jgi:hypothetical protein